MKMKKIFGERESIDVLKIISLIKDVWKKEHIPMDMR